MSLPLRYKICRWPQAVKCLSNNSRKLRIHYSSFMDHELFKGSLIQVTHSDYGVMFTAVIDGEGEIVSKDDNRGLPLPWMTTKEILTQLAKFGFDITYVEKLSLNKETLAYLMKLRNIGYDKITKLYIRQQIDGKVMHRPYFLALQTEHNLDVLTYGMMITEKKFNERLAAGYMFNLANADDDRIDWDWIDALYNIDDVLADNSDIEEFEVYQGGQKIFPPEKIDWGIVPEIDNSSLTPYEDNDDQQGG